MSTRYIDRELCRARFFDRCIPNQKIKDCLAGENEKKVIELLSLVDFKIDKDYFRQYPIAERYVLDFAFPNEQFAIEVDGKTHLLEKQKRKDKIRDSYLRTHNWVTLRIQEKELFGYKLSYYKSLIKIIVYERRKQYKKGNLYPIEFTTFNENDYE